MWNFKHLFFEISIHLFCCCTKNSVCLSLLFCNEFEFFVRKTITGIENWTETVLFLKSNYLEHIENFLSFFPPYMQSFKIISVTPVGIRLWCRVVCGYSGAREEQERLSLEISLCYLHILWSPTSHLTFQSLKSLCFKLWAGCVSSVTKFFRWSNRKSYFFRY